MGEFRPGEDRGAALERALVSYRSYLHVVAAGKLKGREGGIESASDFVQMTMAVAIRDIREGKGPANEEELKLYLRNRMRDEFKRVFRRKRPGLFPIEDLIDNDGTTPSAALRGNLRERRLAAAVRGLNPSDRQLLTWCNEDKLTYAEIARRRGCSPTYARRICQYVIDKLRDAMKMGSTV